MISDTEQLIHCLSILSKVISVLLCDSWQITSIYIPIAYLMPFLFGNHPDYDVKPNFGFQGRCQRYISQPFVNSIVASFTSIFTMSTQATYPLSEQAMVKCSCTYHHCYRGRGGFTMQAPRTERLHRANDVRARGKFHQ